MIGKQRLLVTLLGGLALALGYAYWATPRQQKVVQIASKANPTRHLRAETQKTDRPRVRLDILERGVEAFSEPKRDIFSLSQPRPALPESLPSPMVRVAPPVVPPPIVVSSPLPPPVSVPSFTLLGFLQKDGGQTVFLLLNSDIFVVKEGTRFGNNKEFFAEKLTKQELVIRQDGVSEPIRVSLSDIESIPIATSFKRPVVAGRSTDLGTPVFKKPRHMGAAAVDDGEVDGDVVPESATMDNLWRKPTIEGAPAVPAAEKTDDNMSSLQLRSVFK